MQKVRAEERLALQWGARWRELGMEDGRAVLVAARWRAWELAPAPGVEQTSTEFVRLIVPEECRRAWRIWTDAERLADPRLCHFFDSLHRERCNLRGEPAPPVELEALLTLRDRARQEHAALMVEAWRCQNAYVNRPKYARQRPLQAIAQTAREVCRAQHDRAELADMMVVAARVCPHLRLHLQQRSERELLQHFAARRVVRVA
jgi:hypothetical protein